MRTKPCLTSADVKKMMAACLAEAEKNKWQVAIAIVDDGGFMLSLDRMDGAAVTTAEVAVGKARTAALTKAAEQVLRGPRQGAPRVHRVSGGPLHPGRAADPP